ncbi:MAG: tetratricopeptide repeat protein, partial [Myxococcota bacterium]
MLQYVSRHALAALVALSLGCGGATFNGTRDEAFLTAVEARSGEDWDDAAVGALVYLGTATEDDDRYDRAQMLLAEALRELGFRYGAALYYWDVAQARRNAELADEALLGLQALTTTGHVDDDLLLRSFVASADIEGAQAELADFVFYERGIDNLRRGEMVWATEALAAIDDESPYHARAEMALAAVDLDDGKLNAAKARLESLLGEESETPVPDDTAFEARLALARIALDQERYRSAIRAYEALQDDASDRPSLLLEMAW